MGESRIEGEDDIWDVAYGRRRVAGEGAMGGGGEVVGRRVNCE
jgi:hypothetical protein